MDELLGEQIQDLEMLSGIAWFLLCLEIKVLT